MEPLSAMDFLEIFLETIRDVLLTSPSGTFSFEDISGVPWIEIDFAVDIERANAEIMPRILKAMGNRQAARMIKADMLHQAGAERL